MDKENWLKVTLFVQILYTYTFCKLIFINILFEETIGRVCFLTSAPQALLVKYNFRYHGRKAVFARRAVVLLLKALYRLDS